MEVIYLLLAFSLGIAGLFLGLFFWAVKKGQFDDTQTPSMRMLFETTKKQNKNHNHRQR